MKGKKILSAIIVGVMVLCTMSFPVFAADVVATVTNGDTTTDYTSIGEALSAVQDNGTVTLKTAVSFAGKTLPAKKNVTYTSDGDVTIQHSIGNLPAIDGSITFKGLKFDGNAINIYDSISNAGLDVTIEDCTFVNAGGNCVYIQPEIKSLTVTGCTFTSPVGGAGGQYLVWPYNARTITITDNEFTGNGTRGAIHLGNATETATVSGNTINSFERGVQVALTGGGNVTITDNDFSDIKKYSDAQGRTAPVFIHSATNQDATRVSVTDNTITNSSAAVFGEISTACITEFTGNTVDSADAGFLEENVASYVAEIGDKKYVTLADAVAAAQTATTDKWHIAKITLLTNDALDISKGPDNYVSYNITKNDTVVKGERIADDAHKSYYKLTNASTLYIPADVDSLILENVKNLCRIEIAEGAEVTLKLKGDNELAGNIFVPEGAKLTIEDITVDGTGRLAVYNTTTKEFAERNMNAFGAGDGYSAAIGGSMTQPGGEIFIKSGEIEAYSNYGAAIGGGQQKTAKVTILGGEIKAEASYGAAIGGGQQSTGDVTISGGVIDAKSDRSAPIGGGNQTTEDSNVIISGGDITVARDFGTNLFGNSTGESAGAEISGGTFNTDVSDYCTDGFSPKLVNGVYVVNDLTTEIAVKFVPTSDENVYDIVLSGNGEKIYELVSAELQFVNASKTLSDADMSYEISGTDDINVIPNTANADRYGFYLKDGAVANRKTDTEINIGTVTFPEQGAINFKVDAEGSKVVATEYATHLEKYYTAADANAKLTADANGINSTIAAKTRNVLVKVDYAHKLVGSWTDNQITVTLKDAFGVTSDAMNISDGEEAFADVPVGRITVTLKAPGFRTYTYTTTVEEGTDPLVLSFWNDTKRDTTAEVEAGKAMTKNFVVGDIAMDYTVDKYDLAAVTSYYGTYNLTDANKIKYDLNRDGNIDITDVAYVLHNFGF